jgi:hypothetical protein
MLFDIPVEVVDDQFLPINKQTTPKKVKRLNRNKRRFTHFRDIFVRK